MNKLIRGKASKESLIYAAACFDCEGSVTLSRSINSKGWHQTTIVVSIANIDPAFIKFLVEEFGGNVCTEAPKKLSRRVIYRWKLYQKDAKDFFEMILPYLKIKQDRVRFAIWYVDNKHLLSKEERDIAWQKMKAMNRGESLPAETKRDNVETNLRSDSPILVETPEKFEGMTVSSYESAILLN